MSVVDLSVHSRLTIARLSQLFWSRSLFVFPSVFVVVIFIGVIGASHSRADVVPFDIVVDDFTLTSASGQTYNDPIHGYTVVRTGVFDPTSSGTFVLGDTIGENYFRLNSTGHMDITYNITGGTLSQMISANNSLFIGIDEISLFVRGNVRTYTMEVFFDNEATASYTRQIFSGAGSNQSFATNGDFTSVRFRFDDTGEPISSGAFLQVGGLGTGGFSTSGFSAVPEPSAALVGGLCLAVFGLRRRRR